MTFNELSLDPQIVKAVNSAGYKTPTKIQSQAIPEIINGEDVRASAQTGTGKTAAFLLPALNHILLNKPEPGKGPRILIVVPTRELAMQITQQAEKYSKNLQRINTVCISGGVSYQLHQRKLSKPYDVLIATPGRLIDYLDRGKINLGRVEMLILDEADRMLDMGFQEPVEQIVQATPPSRQTLLFSATLQGPIIRLSDRLLNSPKDIIVHADKAQHENITQKLHYVDNLSHKNRLLDHILNDDSVRYSIIFTSTKRHADQLVRELDDKGHLVAALHGDMNQSQRTRTVKRLKDGKINVLVATDVAARGLDVQSITHVINFDLPRCIEDYVHRIGRTGRAGSSGVALSFAAQQDVGLVKRIEKFTGQQIDIKEIEGLEPSRKRSSSDRRPKSRNRSNQSGSRSRFAPKANSSYRGFNSKGGKFGDQRGGPNKSKGSFSRGSSSRGSYSNGNSSSGNFTSVSSSKGKLSKAAPSKGRFSKGGPSKGGFSKGGFSSRRPKSRSF